ncbi:MAG: hypothetical protein OXE44_17255 [Nitrospinae bacterium]|nr:hypothetical protein [Nitrospinota bacterium]
MTNGNAAGATHKASGWKRMFLDDEGNPSSMRVMAAIAFVASGYLANVEVFGRIASENKNTSDTELVFYFLAAAFVPKALQKFAEGSSVSGDNIDVEQNKKGWFTDNNGNPSSVRLMSLGALLIAIALAVIEVHGWGSAEGKNELVLYFLAAAFVPKSIQKFAEHKPQ